MGKLSKDGSMNILGRDRRSSTRDLRQAMDDRRTRKPATEPGALAVNPKAPTKEGDLSDSFHMDSTQSTHQMDASGHRHDVPPSPSPATCTTVTRRKTSLATSVQADLIRHTVASSTAEPQPSQVGAHAAAAPSKLQSAKMVMPAGSHAALSRQAHHAHSKQNLSLSSHSNSKHSIRRGGSPTLGSRDPPATLMVGAVEVHSDYRRSKLGKGSRHSTRTLNNATPTVSQDTCLSDRDVDAILRVKEIPKKQQQQQQQQPSKAGWVSSSFDEGDARVPSEDHRRRREPQDVDIPVLSEMVSAHLVVEGDEENGMTEKERNALFEQAQREAEEALHEKMVANMVTAEAVTEDELEALKLHTRRCQWLAGFVILVVIFLVGGLVGWKPWQDDDANSYLDANRIPPPLNDVCTAAIPMERGTDSQWQQGSTVGATDSKLPSCTSRDEFVWAKASVWYKVVGKGIPLRVSSNDTLVWDDSINATIPWNADLSVYSGQCGALTCVGGNANDAEQGFDEPASVTWFAEAGVEYFVCLHGNFRATGTMEDDPYAGTTYGGRGGNDLVQEASTSAEETAEEETIETSPVQMGNFSLSLDAAVGNDFCPGAIEMEVSGANEQWITYQGSTAEATQDSVYTLCGNTQSEGAGVWYRVNGTGAPLEVNVKPEEGFNTQATVFQSPMGLDCSELLCIAGDNEPFQHSSHVTWLSEVGVVYFVLVHGVSNLHRGSFQMTIESKIANDLCESAAPLEVPETTTTSSVKTLVGTVKGSSLSSSLGVCGKAVHAGKSVWYSMVGTGETMQVSTCYLAWQAHSSSQTMLQDTVLSVFRGKDCSDLECIDGEDSTCGTHAAVSWKTEPGEVYHILVSGKLEEAGSFQLSWEAL